MSLCILVMGCCPVGPLSRILAIACKHIPRCATSNHTHVLFMYCVLRVADVVVFFLRMTRPSRLVLFSVRTTELFSENAISVYSKCY